MGRKRELALLALLLYSSSMLCAAESIKLETIEVKPNKKEVFIETFAPDESMMASQSYTKEGIETFSAQTNMSALKVINMSPSVNFYSVDAFGSNESSFHDPMRIRGKNQSGPGGVLTIEGLPLNSNPGGGKTIYDMENFSAIDLYKGYMPVDKSLGFSNLIGKVDLFIEQPKQEFGARVSQMVGSENTTRTFMRVDTGKMGDFSAFGSISYTQGDKWKGEGDLKRINSMLGLVYTPSDQFKAELFLTLSKDKHYNYYQMNYVEAKDLDTYYRKDYGSDSGKAAYAEYNKQEFKDTAVMANIEYAFSNGSVLSFKPYYLHDDGEYWFDTKPSNPNNTIIKQWLIDHDLFGAVAQYEHHLFDAMHMKLGYWMHWQQPPGPPTNHRNYNVQSGEPVFIGYGMLADAEDHEFHSPFVEFSGETDGFSYVVGLRYLSFKLAGFKSYQNGTNASTSMDYDTAIANGTLDALASVDSRYYTEWLPSLFFSYALNKSLSLYWDYTRSYGYDVNLFPYYVANRNKGQNFVLKGVTLQQLWDKQQPELSDNFDLGVKYETAGIVLNPNLFLTKVTGKQVSAYDPEFDVVYPTNSADATSYGLELTASGTMTESLDFTVSGSYNRYYYTDDIQTGAATTKNINGNQIPDAPKYMANAAVTYRHGGWRLTPSLRYYSKRYGDVENKQSIPGCTLVDADAAYTQKGLWQFKEVSFRLTIINLFDKHYISSIITPDNALAANTTKTSYQAGAPFGVYTGLELKF